jgi:YidC/Oxa1 family membrane protein insertase
MDFGISFISNNIMLPILDFFYGIVPSYGWAIVALTIVIRFALYPLSAGSIRSMRRTRIAQPLMQKRVKEVQEKYKNDPTKQKDEMSDIYKEFGNPLSGCLPLVFQMPVLFALFATLRGSPFANVDYTVNLQVMPKDKISEIQPQPFVSEPHNIYFSDNYHAPVIADLPKGNILGEGQTAQIGFKTVDGKPLPEVIGQYPNSKIVPVWTVTKGEEFAKIDANGNVQAIAAGEATLKGTVTGIAADSGFLFIDALGHVGAIDPDGKVHWDVLGMIIFFGLSLYVSQNLTGNQNKTGDGSNPEMQASQQTANKLTPIIFSGMFLFFPLPAGVLMYMVIGNVFQTAQTYLLSKEPLPADLQKIVDAQEKEKKASEPRAELPFENKKDKKTSPPKIEPADPKKSNKKKATE